MVKVIFGGMFNLLYKGYIGVVFKVVDEIGVNYVYFMFCKLVLYKLVGVLESYWVKMIEFCV